MERFGNRLLALRKNRGWTSKYVAERLQVAESTYRAWEGGRALQGESMYPRMATLFQVNLWELLTGEKTGADLLNEAATQIESGLAALKAARLRAK